MSHCKQVCSDLRPCKGNNISIIVKEGDEIDLKCSIFPAWKGIIVWSKEGNSYPLTLGTKRFFPDNRITSFFSSSNNWHLKIRNSRLSDQGIYGCSDSVSNEIILHYNVTVEKYDTNIPKDNERLTKSGPPGKMEIKGPNVVFIGESVNIQCRINLENIELPPYPFSSFRWFHNGKQRSSNSQSEITITQSWESTSIIESEVIIKHVNAKHSGSWVCLYALDDSNFTQKNTATASLYLTVLGSPKSSVRDSFSNVKPSNNYEPKILKLKEYEYLNDHESKLSNDKKNHSSTSQKSMNFLFKTFICEIIVWRIIIINL